VTPARGATPSIAGPVSMERMATSNLPTPTLQPVPETANLLTVAEEGASCCGGGCCCGD